MMKMDSFGHSATTTAAAPPTEFTTDFSAIFDKICNMTLSPQSQQPQPQHQQQQQYYQHYHHPSPPVPQQSSARKNSNGFQKKAASVSTRPFKRGESQPNSIGTSSSAAASQRRLRFREFSQVCLKFL
uniref:Uncharacterized protein n=1 Tax=Panagrolaimus sp. PS1159 TaxID=55785 RepID=A0AC35G540_9BILA